MRRKILLITVLVLLMLFAAAPLISLPVKAEESAGKSEVETINAQPAPTLTIFSDGFESGWNWAAYDADSDSGYDYWGRVDGGGYVRHAGTYSAWCAAVSDHPYGTWYYDNDMDAYMYRAVPSGYTSLTLSYWYWTQNEVTGGTQYDFLKVAYWYNGAWHPVASHGGSTSYTWQYNSVSIPSYAQYVGFNFYSDYSNANYYGSYVDDVVLTGVTAKVDTVLDFAFTPNPVQTGTTCTLSGTLRTTPGGSPVYPASVTVDYSTDGGATWHYAFTLSTNAAGAFSTSFTAPGEGTYQVRGRYAGSASYNPSSHIETLTITPAAWGDYHFRISPWSDTMHLKISGSVVYGVHEIPGLYSETPLLGYIEGSTFYIFIDYPDGVYSKEMMMLVGSTSTLSGNAYQTYDGKSWNYAASFSLVSTSSAMGSSATESSLASAVEPEAWPPTYHFRLSPWIDIVRLGVDGSVIHGTCEAAGYYYDQPVLGYLSGSFFMLGTDITVTPTVYELSIVRASTSTMTGYAYRTTDGKSYVSGPTLTFVPV